MSTNEDFDSTLENKTPMVSPGNYSPVTVYLKDSAARFSLASL